MMNFLSRSMGNLLVKYLFTCIFLYQVMVTLWWLPTHLMILHPPPWCRPYLPITWDDIWMHVQVCHPHARWMQVLGPVVHHLWEVQWAGALLTLAPQHYPVGVHWEIEVQVSDNWLFSLSCSCTFYDTSDAVLTEKLSFPTHSSQHLCISYSISKNGPSQMYPVAWKSSLS